MSKMLFISASILALITASAAAGQPEDPGGFGNDRARNNQRFQNLDRAPGASEWGHIAAFRGDRNGEINRDYRERNDQTPTHGNGK